MSFELIRRSRMIIGNCRNQTPTQFVAYRSELGRSVATQKCRLLSVEMVTKCKVMETFPLLGITPQRDIVGLLFPTLTSELRREKEHECVDTRGL